MFAAQGSLDATASASTGIREGVARKASPDMHRSERETASCVACWIVGSSVASLWVAPDGATPLFERGWSSSSAACDFWVPLSIEEGSAVIQQGQVFRLQGGARTGSRCGPSAIASQARFGEAAGGRVQQQG